MHGSLMPSPVKTAGDRLGKGEGSTAIGKHFNLVEHTVRAIKKNEAAIRKSVISGTKLSTKFASYTRDVLLERTERAIAIWIEEQVQRRIPVKTVSSDDEGDLEPLCKRCKPLSDSDND
ncbi:hypothetical protein TNCV_3119931 [Trichonephila clavipes]|uniref:Uncharacterized protein n=1 Tax=Trichonephila clavipes TaxID=2585209 RepID=A0A8X6W9F7_TRICX|nr:hypothetical protein TNCV_3119931 [Trichonephila clavipes]